MEYVYAQLSAEDSASHSRPATNGGVDRLTSGAGGCVGCCHRSSLIHLPPEE